MLGTVLKELVLNGTEGTVPEEPHLPLYLT